MRQPAAKVKPRLSQITSFPAAVGGWIASQNLAQPTQATGQGAVILENIMPTATGGQIRRGSQRYATLEDETKPVDALFSYVTGAIKKFFAANETKIYDITIISQADNINIVTGTGDAIVTDLGLQLGQNSTEGLAVVTGLTSGHWIDCQFATTGGTFLIIVNGADPMYIFDGTAWYPITDKPIITINFGAQTINYPAGATITGGTSGAVGKLIRQTDAGATGTLYLQLTSGTFQNGEALNGAPSGNGTAASGPTTLYGAITGIATSSLNYVWQYKSRLWFLEKGTMNVWYLPVDQITGALTLLPMAGIFNLGGTLQFGASWSLDSGNAGGLSEQNAFFTTEGEVAVFQGDNPAVPASWQKVGVYRIGKPRGPNSWLRAGGDLLISTDIGLIALTQAVQRDYAALAPASVSYPIETEWNLAIQNRSAANWNAITWPERQMVVVALPTVDEQPPAMYIVNARTGAWANFTGWSGTCLEVFNGRMFFGSQSGAIIEAYVTGTDDQNKPYTATYIPLFEQLASPGTIKLPQICRMTSRGPSEVIAKLSAMTDYIIERPAVPSASPVTNGSQWGVGIWGPGGSLWGGQTQLKFQHQWDSVGGAAYASIAPCVQITSGSSVPLDTEIISLEMTWNMSDFIA